MRAPPDHSLRVGRTFERLHVVDYAGSRTNTAGTTRHLYLCLCQCGNAPTVEWNNLQNGHTKSCGCLAAETKAKTRHGHKTRFGASGMYATWQSMLARCNNPNNRSFARYGGRGITVCERWKSFDNFLADMGERPDGMSIERIDNDGPYAPGNCRWASVSEQARNRRSNDIVTLNGESRCATDWCAALGIKYAMYRSRVMRGMPRVEALTTPKKRSAQAMKEAA